MCPPASTSCQDTGRDRPGDPRQGGRRAPRRARRTTCGRQWRIVRRWRPTRRPPIAVDPICGMTVAAVAGTPSVELDGENDSTSAAEGCRPSSRPSMSMPPRKPEPFVSARARPGGLESIRAPKQLLAYRGGTFSGTSWRSPEPAGSTSSWWRSAAAPRTFVRRSTSRARMWFVNDAYGAGCSSSIAASLEALDPRCEVIVLMLGDQPGVAASTVSMLLARSRRCATRDLPLRTTVAGIRSRLRAACSASSRSSMATRASWRLLDQHAAEVAEVAMAGPVPRRRRHAGGLRGGHRRSRGRRGGRSMSEPQPASEAAESSADSRPMSRPSPELWRRSTISSMRGSPRRSSSACACPAVAARG